MVSDAPFTAIYRFTDSAENISNWVTLNNAVLHFALYTPPAISYLLYNQYS